MIERVTRPGDRRAARDLSRSAAGVIAGPGTGPEWVWRLSGAFRCRPEPVRPLRRGPPWSASSARPPSSARRAPRRARQRRSCDGSGWSWRQRARLPADAGRHRLPRLSLAQIRCHHKRSDYL